MLGLRRPGPIEPKLPGTPRPDGAPVERRCSDGHAHKRVGSWRPIRQGRRIGGREGVSRSHKWPTPVAAGPARLRTTVAGLWGIDGSVPWERRNDRTVAPGRLQLGHVQSPAPLEVFDSSLVTQASRRVSRKWRFGTRVALPSTVQCRTVLGAAKGQAHCPEESIAGPVLMSLTSFLKGEESRS